MVAPGAVVPPALGVPRTRETPPPNASGAGDYTTNVICPPTTTAGDAGASGAGPSTSGKRVTDFSGKGKGLGVKAGRGGVEKKKGVKSKVCPHGRRSNGYYCRECGGKGICEHDRQRSKCRDCGGKSVCKHNRIRYQCTECGGVSICPHGRMGYQCKECGGSSICKHKRVRAYCKECKGSQICAHGRVKSHCAACRGSQICEHGVQRGACVTCMGSAGLVATGATGGGPNVHDAQTSFSILKHFG
jgi:hypothetical protein